MHYRNGGGISDPRKKLYKSYVNKARNLRDFKTVSYRHLRAPET